MDWQERPSGPQTSGKSGVVEIPRGSILIIEDQVAVAQVLERALGEVAPCEVVSGGRLAIERLRAGRRYGAVLCDMHMPDGGGFEVVRFLRQSAPELVGRLVLMSGGIIDESWAEGIASVQKPFDMPRLCSLIAGILHRDDAVAPPQAAG